VADDDLRLAEVLAALSVATDLGTGQAPEKAIRSCLLATELADAAGLPAPQVREVYYTALLHHLGCTGPAHELSYLFGDDVQVIAAAESADNASLRDTLGVLSLAGKGADRNRLRHLGRVVAGGKRAATTILGSVCEVGASMAQRLHLGERVRVAVGDSTEVWDGSTGARGRKAEEIAVAARFGLLATQAVAFDRLGGPDAAVQVVRDRTGHWFDPAVAATFLQIGPGVLRRMQSTDVWQEVLDAEPTPGKRLPPSQLDEVSRVFADMVDLKSVHTLGHSTEVADLAARAATALQLPPERVATLRRAGLLHDLGRVAVSGGIWAKAGALTSMEWEAVRLHPYHSQRILERSAALADLAQIAGMHHERHDGSGYHHGLRGAAIPTEARLLAAADAFQAMTQPRPHRPAMTGDQAAAMIEAEARSGVFDMECISAVIAAAGHVSRNRRGSWPAGLTDREVDVLRLVAAGSSNREVATALTISRRTAEHHVQNIYGKIGGSTRAAAALFAMEHGLVR
jgi:HD-GYP domain-containing protein (c-di-GMP phosphodiesterase class II)